MDERDPRDPEERWQGWVNRITMEFALAVENDKPILDRIDKWLKDSVPGQLPIESLMSEVVGSSLEMEVDMLSFLYHRADYLYYNFTSDDPAHLQANRKMTLEKYLHGCNWLQERKGKLETQAEIENKIYNRTASNTVPEPSLGTIDPITLTALKEKTTMKTRTEHFVNDQNVKNMDTSERLQTIRLAEDNIKSLENIESKSKLVAAELEKAKVFLKDVLALFDADLDS